MKAEVKVGWGKHHSQISRDCCVQMILLAEAQVEATKAGTNIGDLQGII